VLVWRTAGALNQSDAVARAAHTRLIAHQGEIEELNKRLRSAMAETHHRVRNNLQIISALADLQVMRDQDTIPISEMQRIGSQVQALAAVHDLLTRDAKVHLGADTLSVDDVLEKLAELLEHAVAGRAIQVQCDDIRVTARQASAIAVVANELIINALKNSPRDVEVRFHAIGQEAIMEVLDRGNGFPEGFDAKVNSGTGLELVHQMASWDLAGGVKFMNREGGGACVRVTLPLSAHAGMRPRYDEH
jgi:two-component sensor histidine kinase